MSFKNRLATAIDLQDKILSKKGTDCDRYNYRR